MVKIEYGSDISELDRIIMQPVGVVEKEYISKLISPGTPAKSMYPLDYRVGDFLDDDILKRIRKFEENNPEKIKKWQTEDEEKQRNWFVYDIYRNVENSEDGNTRKIREIIRICLKYDPNKFVLSVTNQYFKTGKISDKQLQVLTKIAKKVSEVRRWEIKNMVGLQIK